MRIIMLVMRIIVVMRINDGWFLLAFHGNYSLEICMAPIEKCHRDDVYVEDITQQSAMLYWKSAGYEDFMDYKVQIICCQHK